MFFGQYEHSLDDKGRLSIPSKMREEAGSKLFILKGFDGCLSVYKSSEFEKLAKEISSLPFNLKNSRAYIRNQIASACELDVDKVGRILLPTNLVNKYNITKEVIVIGVYDHFEIWSKDIYLAYEKDVNESFEEISEQLEIDKNNG